MRYSVHDKMLKKHILIDQVTHCPSIPSAPPGAGKPHDRFHTTLSTSPCPETLSTSQRGTPCMPNNPHHNSTSGVEVSPAASVSFLLLSPVCLFLFLKDHPMRLCTSSLFHAWQLTLGIMCISFINLWSGDGDGNYILKWLSITML